MTTVLSAKVIQNPDFLTVQVPCLRSTYIDAIMRKNCFEELRELFMHAAAPAKEFTESYAALHHLRPSLKRFDPQTTMILHIGDGAHCRTGAVFAFMTKFINISIDPQINEKRMAEWCDKFKVRNLWWSKKRIEDFPLETYFALLAPRIVTFVHAHVQTDQVLARVPNWKAAYVNICCHPKEQRSRLPAVAEGYDWAILSPEREYQVLLNQQGEQRGLSQ